MREWLKEKRDSKQLNHEEVAGEADISRSYYTLIESGVKTPSVGVAKAIANALDFDWTLFFKEKCSFGEHNLSSREAVECQIRRTPKTKSRLLPPVMTASDT